MPKARRPRESLTGGTGDVNPQWMICQFTPTTPGTTQTVPFLCPINRVPQTSTRATVMEVLRVRFQIPNLPDIANAAETEHLYTASIGTQDHGAVNNIWSTPDVFAMISRERNGSWTAAGTYSDTNDNFLEIDLTDGAGHGVLVATDTVQGQLQGTATFATWFRARILYRVKNVSILEYVGIVQAQQ